ncbi:23996_t:CDS:2 [Gigaspora margarita]|uniref:23996_t:CDS:1 n=1 Tax=Gigaspora margarita TaxID=4874 RepID=A0ABM8VY33_GIGMA|nr:23996_t:CDS:2 [Gigaspora margarita]
MQEDNKYKELTSEYNSWFSYCAQGLSSLYALFRKKFLPLLQ